MWPLGSFLLIFLRSELPICQWKINWWPQGCLFGNFSLKKRTSIFWPKIDLYPLGPVFGNFWSKKLTFDFLNKNQYMWPLGSIFGNLWSKKWTFKVLTKNRFVTSRVHFLRFLVENLNFYIVDQKYIFLTSGMRFWSKK